MKIAIHSKCATGYTRFQGRPSYLPDGAGPDVPVQTGAGTVRQAAASGPIPNPRKTFTFTGSHMATKQCHRLESRRQELVPREAGAMAWRVDRVHCFADVARVIQ